MGQDKATLPFRGRPMVEIALETLRSFCAEVSIAGNRDDLSGFAPVVHETLIGVGPAGGMQAGLMASCRPWAMFVPVDVPLLSSLLLRRWAELVLGQESEGVRLSILCAAGQRHPAISLLHKDCLEPFGATVREGVYKLGTIYEHVSARLRTSPLCVVDAEELGTSPEVDVASIERWFRNVNTPQELVAAEALATARTAE